MPFGIMGWLNHRRQLNIRASEGHTSLRLMKRGEGLANKLLHPPANADQIEARHVDQLPVDQPYCTSGSGPHYEYS